MVHHSSSVLNFLTLIYENCSTQISLKERKRGFHLITSEIEQSFPQLTEFKKGICQVFIQHTSASLALNENADPTHIGIQ
jgi:thiamine phosphate synthase YjbQ (UPF0047 family)